MESKLMMTLVIIAMIGCSKDAPVVTPITSENYVQAETDWNFAGQQAQAGINAWTHNDPVTKDNQTIIRSNRDVVYSLALVDVSEGAKGYSLI